MLTHLPVVVDVSIELLELQFLWNTLLDDEFDPRTLYLKKSGFMLITFPPFTFSYIMAMPAVCPASP